MLIIYFFKLRHAIDISESFFLGVNVNIMTSTYKFSTHYENEYMICLEYEFTLLRVEFRLLPE